MSEPRLPPSLPERAFPWLLLAAGIFYGALLSRLYVGYFNDDAQYIVLARSLLQGRYCALGLAGSPPEISFPPGFPMLLAPFVWLLAPHWDWLRLIPAALTLFSGLIVWKVFDGWLRPGVRLAAVALFLFNPVTAQLSGSIMSDVGLLFASALVFWGLRQACALGASFSPWALGAILVWTAWLRPVGALFAAAAAPFLARARGWKAAAQAIVPAVALCGVLAVRNRLAAGEVTTYASYWRETLSQIFSGGMGFWDNWHRAAYLLLGHCLLGARLPHGGWGIWASMGLIVAAAGLAAAGWTDLLRRRPAREATAAMGLAVLGCFFVQAVWPVMDSRYFLPLLPWMTVFLVQGWASLCGRLPRSRAGLAIGVAVLAAVFMAHDLRLLRSTWLGPRPQDWLLPRQGLDWVARHTSADAVLLTKVPMVFLYTGRQGIPEVRADDSEEFRFHCLRQRVAYVFDMPFPIGSNVPGSPVLDQARTWQRSMAWAGSWPEAFEPGFTDSSEGTSIYKVTADQAFLRSYELYLAGRQNLARGDLKSGLARLDDSLRLRPRLVAALNAKGAALLLAGRLDQSRAVLGQALAIRPDHALALANLARLKARQGLSSEARRLYARAMRSWQRTGEFRNLGPALESEAAALRSD
ncbi:MAG TPA: hypothetical protein DEB40_11675 [Elusimicrobia bacterium]|nr:hypothetical protein [Elusimicrobiota bacterium]HBT62392.1 hypothetical protein [Elusimicrobiota bacterium]